MVQRWCLWYLDTFENSYAYSESCVWYFYIFLNMILSIWHLPLSCILWWTNASDLMNHVLLIYMRLPIFSPGKSIGWYEQIGEDVWYLACWEAILYSGNLGTCIDRVSIYFIVCPVSSAFEESMFVKKICDFKLTNNAFLPSFIWKIRLDKKVLG